MKNRSVKALSLLLCALLCLTLLPAEALAADPGAERLSVRLAANGDKPTITTQPKNVSAAVGDTVTFKVVATGATQYQWQYSTDGGTTWKDCGATGYDQPTFSFTMKSTFSGRKYRCVVSNSSGSVNSSAATLTVK